MELPTITRADFGEPIAFGSLQIMCTIADDEHTGEPWKEHDGHGPVSDWVARDKRPGERVLSQDGNSYRYYDIAEAQRIALRDGWGVEGGKRDGESDRQYAARAVEHDFTVLQSWCNDGWGWVGVVVEIKNDEQVLVHDSLWGIESESYPGGDDSYLVETANDLLTQELVDEAYRQLGKITLSPQLAGSN